MVLRQTQPIWCVWSCWWKCLFNWFMQISVMVGETMAWDISLLISVSDQYRSQVTCILYWSFSRCHKTAVGALFSIKQICGWGTITRAVIWLEHFIIHFISLCNEQEASKHLPFMNITCAFMGAVWVRVAHWWSLTGRCRTRSPWFYLKPRCPYR